MRKQSLYVYFIIGKGLRFLFSFSVDALDFSRLMIVHIYKHADNFDFLLISLHTAEARSFELIICVSGAKGHSYFVPDLII